MKTRHIYALLLLLFGGLSCYNFFAGHTFRFAIFLFLALVCCAPFLPWPKSVIKFFGEDRKNRLVYAILGLLFGFLGLHNFYAGRMKAGIVQLLLTLFCCGPIVSWPWALIESFAVEIDGNGRFMDDSRHHLRIVVSLSILLLYIFAIKYSMPLAREALREYRNQMNIEKIHFDDEEIEDTDELENTDEFEDEDAACPENIMLILDMAQDYAEKNNGTYPNSIRQLQTSSSFDGETDIFYCPLQDEKKAYSYIFLLKMKNDMNPNMPLIIEQIGTHPGSITLGLIDGSALKIKYDGENYAGLLNHIPNLTEPENAMLGKQFKAIDERLEELNRGEK